MSLELKSVSFAYQRSDPVVADLSLTVGAGTSVALIGPSGAGKSTVLALAGRLLTPSGGVVRLTNRAGSPMTGPPAAEIAWVFQSLPFFRGRSALDNVAMAVEVHGESRRQASDRARLALESVGLADVENHRMEELSGGQGQRVCVARAIVGEPLLILADEPTGQLDAASKSAVVDSLLETSAACGAAVLIATHDPAVAARCGRVIQLPV